jgi:uncharacterized protein (DUF927 family)
MPAVSPPLWENAPPQLASKKQWLVWRFEDKPGQTKPAKIPYYAKGTRRAGEQGSDKDRARLVLLPEARSAFERGGYDGVGFALLPNDELVGIDLDHVIDPVTGEVKQQALAIVKACASFSEYSPSGTGLHVIVQGTTTTNKSNDIGVEVFCGRQYFTFTGKRFGDTPADVLPVGTDVFQRLHATINKAKNARKGEPAAVKLTSGDRTPDEFKRVNAAALRSLAAWVPDLLPAAVPKGDGYRVTSKALNRPNQEDLSVTPAGIVDFGQEGTGDPKDGRRTPIDLVIEWGPVKNAKEALTWLAKRLGIDVVPSKVKTPATGDDKAPYDPFSCDEEGLWYTPPGADAPKKFCAPLYVTAWARDQYDNGAALQVEFTNVFGQARRHLLLTERLAGDGAQMRSELNAMGFFCPTDLNRRRWLLDYLLTRKPAGRVRYVSKCGWWENCYVLAHETLGKPTEEAVVFWSESPIEGGMSQRGTLQTWQRDLARLAAGNSRLALCISMAFAAPLMRWSGVAGGGVVIVGPSSTGKTTGGQLAASVNGLGAEGQPNSYIQKARATSNGAEYQAEHFNDGLLILDELIHLDPADIGNTIHTLADGVGKERAKAAGGLRRKPTWKVMLLFTSEVSVSQHMETANKRARGGLDVRLISLPAEVVPKSMFETTYEFENGAAMADWIKANVAKSYGVAGRMWLEYLVANVATLASELRERMAVLEELMVHPSSGGQVRRGARRFCLIAAAGEMAIEAGILPWTKGTAAQHVHTCFDAWTATREGGVGSSDDAAMVAQVRQFIVEHGQLRLPDIGRDEQHDDRAPRTGMRVGWSKVSKKTSDGSVAVRDYYIFVDAFRNLVCKGINYKSALALLRDRGYLMPGPIPAGGKVGRFDRREYHPLEGHATVIRLHSTILDQVEVL